MKHTLLAVALATLALHLSGCGGVSDQPELGRVTGTIMLDGEPLSDIAVVFHPDNGRPARGKTDSDGKYELTYIRQTRGCKVGHNRVEIAPNEEGENEELEEDSEEAGNTEDVGAAKRPMKRGKAEVPARYNSKSELEADVQPGENVFDFKLDSKQSARATTEPHFASGRVRTSRHPK
jgi:hypothetical protein